MNNAGAAWRGSFADIGWEGVEKHMKLNFDATLRLTHALLPILRRSAPSSIVNVASVAGRISRAALRRVLGEQVRADRLERRPPRARRSRTACTSGMVLPGFVTTEGFPQRELMEKPLTRRIVSTPEKVADAIVAVGPGGKAERYVPRPYWVIAALRTLAPRAHPPRLGERARADDEGRRPGLISRPPGGRSRG